MIYTHLSTFSKKIDHDCFFYQMIIIPSLRTQCLSMGGPLKHEAWCSLLHGQSTGQAAGSGPHREKPGQLLCHLVFPCWQMGLHCFKVSIWKIQTLRVNLHFKIAVFEGNYGINENPMWSSGFSLYVSFGRARSLF